MTEYKSPLKDALCSFKKKKISIPKESLNPHFKSKYADLATILDYVEAEAASVGLIVTSRVVPEGDKYVLITTLECTGSDEVKESVFPIFGSKPQEFGSSMTYARRYNIQSLLNLAADDDDGNEASNAKPLAAPKVSTMQSRWSTAAARKAAFNQIMDELNQVASSEDLNLTWVANTELIKQLKQSDEQIFLELEKRKDALKKQFSEMVGA